MSKGRMYGYKLENNNSSCCCVVCWQLGMVGVVMRAALLIGACLALSGCVTNAALTAQNGQRYPLEVNRLSKSLAVNVDGIEYKGRFVMDRSIGFGSSQGSIGTLQASSFGSMVVAGSNGQTILTSSTGGYIECAFKANGPTAVGKCQSNDGRQFVLTTD